MAFIGEENVKCVMKLLRTEEILGVTLDDKLAAWEKGRELGVCPKFKQVERTPIADPEDEPQE